MEIIQKKSPNFYKGRNGYTPDMIVCHLTEGAFDGSVSWILNKESQVSYHFIVAKDGRIVQAVDLMDGAWGNGTNNSSDSYGNQFSTLALVRERKTNANYYTISIGFEGKQAESKGVLTPQQLEAAVWLIEHINSQFTIPFNRQHIVAHSEVVPKAKPYCPGAQFPFEEIIARLNAGAGRFNTVAEMPKWAQKEVTELIERGFLKGTGEGLDLSEDMIRCMIFTKRMVDAVR